MAHLWKWTACLLFAAALRALAAESLTPADLDAVQERQRQRQLLQQNQNQRNALWNTVAPQAPPDGGGSASGPCFPLHHIVIRNASLLSQSRQQNITAPYGMCD